MRSGTFWIILLVVFAAAFWWAGGASLLPQGASGLLPQSASGLLTQLPAKPDLNLADDDTALTRIHRVFAIRSAVESKIDRKNYTRLKDIPLTMQQAIIAVEDHRFYKHVGLDLEGILRATLVNLQAGTLQEGASTITQQLIKNLFLTSDRTWGRKAEEIVLALDMELRYSKEEILEIYLNTIYFGSGAKGITPAAKIYFGKKPAELSLPESALLAGLPNAPSAYSPYVDFTAAKQRQAIVLTAMSKYGFIGPTTAQEARQAPLRLAK